MPWQWYSYVMRATIDAAGRVVIPKLLRDRLGMGPGVVEIVADGSGVRVDPVALDSLVEHHGRMVIPAGGSAVDDELVRALRDADQR